MSGDAPARRRRRRGGGAGGRGAGGHGDGGVAAAPGGAGGPAPAPAPRATFGDLPFDVLLRILRLLGADPDSVAAVLSSGRDWRALAGTPDLYRQLCAQLGLPAPPAGAAAPAARAHLAAEMAARCHQCRRPTELRAVPITLTVRLCDPCRRAMADPGPADRLISTREALWRFALRPPDLSGLPYAVAGNPVNPRWDPMRCYRRRDVLARALEVHGSRGAMEARLRRGGRAPPPGPAPAGAVGPVLH